MDILHTANNAIDILNEGLMKIRIEERTRNRQIFRIPRFTDYSAAVFYALCAILCQGNFRHRLALSPVGGGAEVMGAANELARKAVPITSAP